MDGPFVAGGAAFHALQITSQERSNDAFSWTGHGTGTTTYDPDGLNQYDQIDAGTPTPDRVRGRLLTMVASTMAYSMSGSSEQAAKSRANTSALTQSR